MRKGIRRVGCRVTLVWLCVLACGCARGVVRPEGVTEFSEGVAQVRRQAQLAFHEASALAREESIRYVLSTTRPGITESDFTPALSAEAIAQWDAAFGVMQSYASAVQQLISPERPAALGNAVVSLGNELWAGTIQASVPPTVATAFTKLGQVLITIKAENDAQAAMRKADPGVREALVAMADALGTSNRSGVRGTVWSNWAVRLAEGPVRDFSRATTANNPEGRRAAAEAYLAMLEQRDAQLSSLASLRDSLLLLADAHTAAANGSGTDAAGIIAMISQQVDQTRALFERFAAIESARARKKTGPATTRSSDGG
jgi:hypothetical protein